MTDPERDYLLRQVGNLERRLRRWRLACFALLAMLVLPVIVGGLLGVSLSPRWDRDRALLEAERDRARAAEMRARAVLDELTSRMADAEDTRTLERKDKD